MNHAEGKTSGQNVHCRTNATTTGSIAAIGRISRVDSRRASAVQWAGIECASDFARRRCPSSDSAALSSNALRTRACTAWSNIPRSRFLIEASNCVRQVCFKMRELVENLEDHKGSLSSSSFRSPYLFRRYQPCYIRTREAAGIP